MGGVYLTIHPYPLDTKDAIFDFWSALVFRRPVNCINGGVTPLPPIWHIPIVPISTFFDPFSRLMALGTIEIEGLGVENDLF